MAVVPTLGGGCGGGRVGAAVLHGPGDGDAGGPAVPHEPADAVLEAPEQLGEAGFGALGVDGGGELAVEGVGDGEELVEVAVADDEGGGPEALDGEASPHGRAAPTASASSCRSSAPSVSAVASMSVMCPPYCPAGWLVGARRSAGRATGQPAALRPRRRGRRRRAPPRRAPP